MIHDFTGDVPQFHVDSRSAGLRLTVEGRAETVTLVLDEAGWREMFTLLYWHKQDQTAARRLRLVEEL